MGISTLISTHTADGDSELDITSNITSAYDEYMFVCTDIGPATDGAHFSFQANVASASGFNETMTTTFFDGAHTQDGTTAAALTYNTGADQAQGTDYQQIAKDVGNAAERSTAGILHLFSPSNTTYVTHYRSRFQCKNNVGSGIDASGTYSVDFFTAGYFNLTGAIDEISFKMSSGDFDGVIQMYGIS